MVRQLIADKSLNYDYVVGVPYAALSLASVSIQVMQ
jgi:orotate phosphoribosyltransferase